MGSKTQQHFIFFAPYFRKKVMSYANSASGSGKLVEITAAFVEVWYVNIIKREQ